MPGLESIIIMNMMAILGFMVLEMVVKRRCWQKAQVKARAVRMK